MARFQRSVEQPRKPKSSADAKRLSVYECERLVFIIATAYWECFGSEMHFT